MSEFKTPANLQPYVNTLGAGLAAKFFLEYGGSEVYLSHNSSLNSMVARAIGIEQTNALAKILGGGHVKVPVAKFWLAKYYREVEGCNNAQIARKIRVDVSSVRRWFSPKSDRNQLSLFE